MSHLIVGLACFIAGVVLTVWAIRRGKIVVK